MAYDEELAGRVRGVLSFTAGISEKRMFGGLAFLLHGRMLGAASNGGGLMLRLDPDAAGALVDGESVRPFRMNGRELPGWLKLEPDAVDTEEALRTWLDRAIAHVRRVAAG